MTANKCQSYFSLSVDLVIWFLGVTMPRSLRYCDPAGSGVDVAKNSGGGPNLRPGSLDWANVSCLLSHWITEKTQYESNSKLVAHLENESLERGVEAKPTVTITI